jgi:phage-related protein
MRNILSSMAATTATGARTVISRLRTGLAVAHATVTGAFSGAAGWLISAGSSIINGLVSGIRGAFGRIRSAVSELGGLIPSWARGALNINSPSKVMIPIGESTMEGVEVGINRKRNDLRNMVQGIGSMIPAAATAGIGSGGGANVSGGLTFNINVSGVSGEQAGQRAAERVLKDLAAAGLVR